MLTLSSKQKTTFSDHLSVLLFTLRTCFKPSFIIKPFFKICQGGHKDHFTVYNTQLSRVSCLMTSGEVYLRVLYTCTYAVVNDRWGATDVATLSLHFILFPASLTIRHGKTSTLSIRRCCFPNASFVGPFFSLLALVLVKSPWQALMILIHAQTTLGFYRCL